MSGWWNRNVIRWNKITWRVLDFMQIPLMWKASILVTKGVSENRTQPSTTIYGIWHLSWIPGGILLTSLNVLNTRTEMRKNFYFPLSSAPLCCLLHVQCGTEIQDTDLVMVENTLTDVCFEEPIVLWGISGDAQINFVGLKLWALCVCETTTLGQGFCFVFYSSFVAEEASTGTLGSKRGSHLGLSGTLLREQDPRSLRVSHGLWVLIWQRPC